MYLVNLDTLYPPRDAIRLHCYVVVQDTEEVNREACGRTGVGGLVYHVIVDRVLCLRDTGYIVGVDKGCK